MIKSLIAVAMASILITQPPQNTNDGTYYQDVNITESYEYETNEVNSVDDLVVGNIYKLEIDNISGLSATLSCNEILQHDFIFSANGGCSGTFAISNYPSLTIGNGYLYIYLLESNNANNETIFFGLRNSTQNANISLICYFVFQSVNNNDLINYISASDYLGEKTITVEPVEAEGLYNLAYHFLYSRIYTNTELQGMETTLFGATINMNMWLSHTTAIVIICLLLVVLIKFVLWLFKIVSGGMLWK